MQEAPPNESPSATSAQHSLLPQSVREWLAVGGVLSVGLLLRLTCLDAPLWIDELHTSWVVSGDFGEVASRAAVGNQPPAFFWLVWGITHLASQSELSLRLASVIAGTLSIVVSYGLMRKWTSSHVAGIATAVLVATDRNMLFYATEARSYALVQLVGLVQLGAVWHVIRQRQLAGWVPLHLLIITTSVILVYLHFTAALLLAVECLVVFGLLILRKLPSGLAPWLFADACAVLLLLVPLHDSFLNVMQRKGNWQPYVSPQHWLANYARALRFNCYLVIPFAVAILGWLRRPTLRLRKPQHGGLVWFICLWTLLPLVFMLASGMSLQPVLIRRFAVISLFGPIMLCALSIARLPKFRWQLLAVVVAVGISLWQSGMVAQLRTSGKLVADKREQWRDAIEQINQDRRQGDFVLVHSGLIEARTYATGTAIEQAYCLLPISGIYPLLNAHHAPLPEIGSAASLNTIRTWAGEHDRVWLLLRIGSDRASRLRNKLVAGGFHIAQHGRYGGVQTFLVTPPGISRDE